MNFKKLKTGALLLTVVFLIVYSCVKNTTTPYFLLDIDDITVPEVAYAEDSISVYISGSLNINECQTFVYPVLYQPNDSTIVIDAYGVQDCWGNESSFTHELTIVLSEAREYTIFSTKSGVLVEIAKIVAEVKGDDPIINEESFDATIDGIYAPPTAFATDTVPVHIFGRLGVTDCYIFDNAEFYMQDNNIVLLKAKGIQKSGDIVCSAALPVFNHELSVVFPVSGKYTFVTMQSNKLVEVGKIEISAKP